MKNFRLVELLVALAVIAFIAVWFCSALIQAKARANHVTCADTLKQISLSFAIWSGDHHGEYPMGVPETNGGRMEFTTGANAFRHFEVMSNELSTPKVLVCPADRDRVVCATNFSSLRNANVSYFVGVDVPNASMIVSGDRNIINGSPLKNGLLELPTNKPARWTSEMHNGFGNLALADGSVQQVSDSGLQNRIALCGAATNRLQLPILGP